MTTAEQSPHLQAQPNQPRMLTPAEVGTYIRFFRENLQWSQEQLAEISGLNVRTIQRVEQGQGASLDTRRALARAFELNDVDALNKPVLIQTNEELQTQKEKFEREFIMMTALPLTTGRDLAKLVVLNQMDLSEPGFDLGREAHETFAAMVDYYRDYRDCADVYSESNKLDVYDDLQSHIDELRRLGVSLRYAQRRVQTKWGTDPQTRPMPMGILYVVAFPLGQEPEQFATPKTGGLRL